MQMIATENLSRKFDGMTAVDGLSFHVDRGEIFGMLGRNGAGKTTTIRMICCLIGKTSGKATVGGFSIDDPAGTMSIRKLIGLVPDNVGLYEFYSAYKNLMYFGRLYETPESRITSNIESLMKKLDLWDRKDDPVSTYSKGMKQKVAIARALVHDPEILVMDEPTANLDPEAARTIRDTILDLKKEGRTILLNTHNLDEAQRLCDTIGILKTKLLAVGKPQNLERSIFGRNTVIQLEYAGDEVVQAVRGTNPRKYTVEGNSITLELDDPEKETPRIVSAIVAAGGKIKSVNETTGSLEDVYLKLVRGE